MNATAPSFTSVHARRWLDELHRLQGLRSSPVVPSLTFTDSAYFGDIRIRILLFLLHTYGAFAAAPIPLPVPAKPLDNVPFTSGPAPRRAEHFRSLLAEIAEINQPILEERIANYPPPPPLPPSFRDFPMGPPPELPDSAGLPPVPEFPADAVGVYIRECYDPTRQDDIATILAFHLRATDREIAQLALRIAMGQSFFIALPYRVSAAWLASDLRYVAVEATAIPVAASKHSN